MYFMNNKKIIVIIVLFVIVMVGAVLGYRYLSQKYEPERIVTEDIVGDTVKEDVQKKDVNTRAPEFSVMDNDGNIVKFSEFLGKPIVLNFWATWCGPCQMEMPAFENIYKKYGDELEVMMINLTDGTRDTVEDVKEFIEENGYGFPVYYDTQNSISQAYNTYSIPVTIFIDKNGNIAEYNIGAMNESTLNKYVENLINTQ